MFWVEGLGFWGVYTLPPEVYTLPAESVYTFGPF